MAKKPSPPMSREEREAREVILARAGFKLYSRPSKGPNVWKRNGVSYKEEDALFTAKREGYGVP